MVTCRGRLAVCVKRLVTSSLFSLILLTLYYSFHSREPKPSPELGKSRLLEYPTSAPSWSARVWDGVDLDVLAAKTYKHKHHGMVNISTRFHPGMNRTERGQMSAIVRIFARIADRANVTYFLYSGSLLGSYRHHGMVPWDDDIDLAVNISQQPALKDALSRHLPLEYDFMTRGPRWKVWCRDSPKPQTKYDWRFPFLDLSFFNESGNTIADADKNYPKFKYPRESVFPLTRRPFWDTWLPAPARTRDFLRATYRLDKCVSPTYSHKREAWIQGALILSCDTLRAHFPFVTSRNKMADGVTETLQLRDSVVSRITL